MENLIGLDLDSLEKIEFDVEYRNSIIKLLVEALDQYAYYYYYKEEIKYDEKEITKFIEKFAKNPKENRKELRRIFHNIAKAYYRNPFIYENYNSYKEICNMEYIANKYNINIIETEDNEYFKEIRKIVRIFYDILNKINNKDYNNINYTEAKKYLNDYKYKKIYRIVNTMMKLLIKILELDLNTLPVVNKHTLNHNYLENWSRCNLYNFSHNDLSSYFNSMYDNAISYIKNKYPNIEMPKERLYDYRKFMNIVMDTDLYLVKIFIKYNLGDYYKNFF